MASTDNVIESECEEKALKEITLSDINIKGIDVNLDNYDLLNSGFGVDCVTEVSDDANEHSESIIGKNKDMNSEVREVVEKKEETISNEVDHKSNTSIVMTDAVTYKDKATDIKEISEREDTELDSEVNLLDVNRIEDSESIESSSACMDFSDAEIQSNVNETNDDINNNKEESSINVVTSTTDANVVESSGNDDVENAESIEIEVSENVDKAPENAEETGDMGSNNVVGLTKNNNNDFNKQEKKSDAKKENFFKTKKFIIIASCVALLICLIAIAVIFALNKNKNSAHDLGAKNFGSEINGNVASNLSEVYELNDATISVWYIADSNSDKITAMENIAKNFKKEYPNITVDLKAISAFDYQNEIMTAFENNSLPTLFESSIVSSEVIDNCIELDEVLSSEEVSSCDLLKDYNLVYSSHKQLPIAIDIPLVCVAPDSNYSNSYFSSANDFSSLNLSMDSNASYIVNKNLDTDSLVSECRFIYTGESFALLTSAMNLGKLKDVKYNCAFLESDKVTCLYVEEWSIRKKAGSDNAAAAERFLAFMLTEESQTELFVDANDVYALPVQSNALNKLTDNKTFNGFDKATGSFEFVQYDPEITGISLYVPETIRSFAYNAFYHINNYYPADDEINNLVNQLTSSEYSAGFVLYTMINGYDCLSRGLTNEEFVNMIHEVYSPEVNVKEFTEYWTTTLNSGMLNRDQIVNVLISSDNWINRCFNLNMKYDTSKDIIVESASDKVLFNFYVVGLNRIPSKEEYEYWRGVIAKDGLEYCMSSLFASNEFDNRGNSLEEYINKIYVISFGRKPDPTGLQYMLGLGDKEAVLAAIIKSDEWSKIVG